MAALDALAHWPVDHVAAAIAGPAGTLETHGDIDRRFELASVTKLMTAMATLVAHEEGTVDLDAPVTSAGAGIADLLAHSAGIAPDEQAQLTTPRTRRIYSTAAYDMIADRIAASAGMAFDEYLEAAVSVPLGMTATDLAGSAGAGGRSCVRDLLRLADAWRRPVLIDETTRQRATTAHLPELAGVLPGFGRQTPNPWGLGPEIRGDKSPHWTSPRNAPTTFGHFGQSGTMLWIDPVADLTTIVLTDRPFGDWAADAWPTLSTMVLTS